MSQRIEMNGKNRQPENLISSIRKQQNEKNVFFFSRIASTIDMHATHTHTMLRVRV